MPWHVTINEIEEKGSAKDKRDLWIISFICSGHPMSLGHRDHIMKSFIQSLGRVCMPVLSSPTSIGNFLIEDLSCLPTVHLNPILREDRTNELDRVKSFSG
jgi:hypothetical protein